MFGSQEYSLYLCKSKVTLSICMNMEYIERDITNHVLEAQGYYPVVLLTGPRQSGKTSLARHVFSDYSFSNLEDLSTLEAARADVNSFLDGLGDKAIIDEVQNYPELLRTLQARVDADPSLRYVLTGSNNFSVLHTTLQSLSGRAALFTLLPFSFRELGPEFTDADTESLMWRGFYPGTTARGIPPRMFFRNYYATYVERDIRALGRVHQLDKFQLFMRLCAARAGSELNSASLGVEVGVSAVTIASWVSLLKVSYIVYTLPPYFANIGKRLTKTPKLYFYDTGLLCYLLGIEEPSQLALHPLKGAVFENMAVGEMVKARFNAAEDMNLCFYRENSGRGVDVVQITPLGLRLYEIKAGKTFRGEFTRNTDYLKTLLPDVVSATVVYDGPAMGRDIINVREL